MKFDEAVEEIEKKWEGKQVERGVLFLAVTDEDLLFRYNLLMAFEFVGNGIVTKSMRDYVVKRVGEDKLKRVESGVIKHLKEISKKYGTKEREERSDDSDPKAS